MVKQNFPLPSINTSLDVRPKQASSFDKVFLDYCRCCKSQEGFRIDNLCYSCRKFAEIVAPAKYQAMSMRDISEALQKVALNPPAPALKRILG